MDLAEYCLHRLEARNAVTLSTGCFTTIICIATTFDEKCHYDIYYCAQSTNLKFLIGIEPSHTSKPINCVDKAIIDSKFLKIDFT